ncbi:sigma factor-like helix-turn-helix DNA-binding protein [Paenibacillus sp. 1A_MP2]|uniref:sigma factor-like helix-turn-helix DNA-binding protein n=1 Tax=Paenibacillus sp. 1A_MP2 TaxID=3457495 RepID=UPI003FCC794A
MENQQTVYERYRKEIYRIGWRVQYRAKKIKYRELPIFEDEAIKGDFTFFSENKIMAEQLISSLPDIGKNVLSKIYLEGYKESEVALKLNISQQAVNKWKRKMLNLLSQKISS